MAGFFDVHERLNTPPAVPPPSTPGSESTSSGKAEALSVTQFTAQLKQALKGAFPYTVTIKGEISNYRGPNHSGHLYFSIKDTGAILPVVMFAGAAKNIKFKLADGLEVIVTGRIDVYEQGGKYNFILSSITPVGTGALELAYRQLYAKLQAEGLFEPERKKPIPDYPRTIALVTSRGAAGLQDQLKVLRRFPFLRIIVVHVPVQGEGAATRIAAALDGLSKRHTEIGGIDLILLGRGGGSYEDLFEFSREEVARAVARCALPVITGIGHEVDTAIADLVADQHAHTPTEAATYAVRNWKIADEFILGAAAKLKREIRATLQYASQRLEAVAKTGFFARPAEITDRRHQRVDDREQRTLIAIRELIRKRRVRLDLLEQRLSRHDPRRVLLARRDRLFKSQQRLEYVLGQRFRRLEAKLGALLSRLERRSPTQRLHLAAQRLATVESRLTRGMEVRLKTRADRLSALEAQLRVLGPDSVLARGFSITTNRATGKVVRTAAEAKPGEVLITRVTDGEISSRVE